MKRTIITIKYFSRAHHCSQVITGFHMFAENSNDYYLKIEDHREDPNYPYKGPFVEVNLHGKKLIYDMLDGYQCPTEMMWFYQHSDYYFKRSFSSKENVLIGFSNEKTFPYGFNYFVTYLGNPLDGPVAKDFIKGLLGQNHNTIFTPKAFEEIPRKTSSPKILFSARLWPNEDNLSEALNEERRIINGMRIRIVKELSSKYPSQFVGGLYDTPLARQLAPEYIIPKEFTIKKNYLKRLHQCDICIGTMGLHKSIGGKTGEYVAAAKAIVQESLHYDVTGDFAEGINYLSFNNAEVCLSAVEKLVNDPELVYRMKLENQKYYINFLRPDKLVENTLVITSLI